MRERPRRRTGRGATSFRRSLRIQRRRRADAQARAPRHSLHLDPRRAGLRGRRGAARPRAHRARGRPERHSHPDAGAGLTDAGCRALARVRRDRRDARAPPGNSAIDTIVAELMPVYGSDCPGAVVARATWPDERIVRGTLADIGPKLATEKIERTAIILIGRALAAQDFRDSALYDPTYRRRFRGEGKP